MGWVDRRVFIPLILWVCLGSCGSYVGTKGLVVSKLGFGPRASALGETFVGLSDDVSALYWNPAGLSQLDSSEVYFIHQAWFASQNDEYLAYAHPFPFGTLGMNISLSQNRGIESWDENDQRGQDFSTWTLLFQPAYGRRVDERWAWGVSLKGVVESLSQAGGGGLALDCAGLFKPAPKWRVGAKIYNLGTPTFGGGQGWAPLALRLGGLYKPVDTLNILADLDFPIDNIPNLHLGIEYWFYRIAALRVGFKTGPQSLGRLGASSGFTFGLGINYEGFIFDYCLIPYGELGTTHRLGLGYRFKAASTTTQR